MNYELNYRKHKKDLEDFIKKETLLVIAATLALGTSFLNTPRLKYIDFKVLVLLLNLMLIVAAFKELRVLDKIANYLLKRCTTYKGISYTLVFLTFFSAMVVTNDVALITFVPLALIISKKAIIQPGKIIIYQTLAANLGSTLTPMGNPQNLFIYSYFKIEPIEFLKITLPLVLLAAVFLIALVIQGKTQKLTFEVENITIQNKRHVIVFSALFLIILLSVFKLIDYRVAFIITVISILFIKKELFRKVDYSLLLTFVAFFIFIGNISSMGIIKNFMANILATGKSTFISSIAASQFISNVPATMLL